MTGTATLPGLVFASRAAAAVPPQVTLPDRGIWDDATSSTWTDGFLSGNGEYGAVYYGAPTLEKMIFNHHRFVLPNGSRDVMPPVISGYLESARDKAWQVTTPAPPRPSPTGGTCAGRRPSTPATNCACPPRA